jgi:hypothetical protein
MAKASSIARLHTVNNLSANADAEPDPVTQSEAPSLFDLYQQSLAQPLHRRFLTPRRSRNDSPALMSSMPQGVPVDQSDAFAALAAQDRFRALLAKHPRRCADDAQPWAAIQL